MRIGPDGEPNLRVLNLGAGVQSSTLLLMACAGELPRPDVAIFADTQWEPAAVYEWLDFLEGEAQQAGIRIDRVTAGNIRDDVVAAVESKDAVSVGQPPFFIRGRLEQREGKLWRKCSHDYKADPIRKRIRELLGVKRITRHLVEQWYGMSLDEVSRMRTPGDPWAVNWYPLIEMKMRRSGCLEWMLRNGHPEPPRSACIGCPFHNNYEWRKMRDERPEEWQDAVDFDSQVRTGLPGVKGKAFCHRSTIPLSDVDLSTDEDHGQLGLWNNECEGVCGV